MFEEGIIEGSVVETDGDKPQRGRGSPTTRWTAQQPKVQSRINNVITNGIQGAEKLEENKKLGDHSKATQAAYRQLQFIQYALKRSEGDGYQQTPQHITVRLDKTYNDHTGILDPSPHNAFKAGFISKPTSLIRVKAELAELLRAKKPQRCKPGELTRQPQRTLLRTATKGCAEATQQPGSHLNNHSQQYDTTTSHASHHKTLTKHTMTSWEQCLKGKKEGHAEEKPERRHSFNNTTTYAQKENNTIWENSQTPRSTTQYETPAQLRHRSATSPYKNPASYHKHYRPGSPSSSSS